MITLLERGLADFIAARVVAAALGYPVETRAATHKAALPEDRPTIIAQCMDMPNDVAGSKEWTAALAIYATSNAAAAANTADKQAALELLITDMFEVASESAVNAAVSARLSGYTAASFARLGWRPGRKDTTWAPYLEVSLQVTKSA